MKISDDYLTGFVDGEGCFYIGFSKRLDLPLKWQIITEFHLSQNPGGHLILKAFQDRLKCGYIKANHYKSKTDKSLVLIIKRRQDLVEKLLPFFDKHLLYSNKSKDYAVFKEVLLRIAKKDHLTKLGFNKIVNLVFSLKRNTNKKYSRRDLLIK